jgi:hypothetical protein
MDLSLQGIMEGSFDHILDDPFLSPKDSAMSATSLLASDAVPAVPAPPPTEAWSLADPPSGAPAQVSYLVVPAEQIRQWQQSIAWMQQQLAIIDRAAQAAETNAQTFQQQKAAMERQAAAAEALVNGMSAAMAQPVTQAVTTSLQLADGLLQALAPVMTDKTALAVLQRVKALVDMRNAFASSFK